MARGNKLNADSFSIVAGGESDSVGDPNTGNPEPNGNGAGNAGGAVDPAEIARAATEGTEFTGGTNKDGSPTRKRGRKTGSQGSSGKEKTGDTPHIDAEGVEILLLSIHSFLATKVPEMELSQPEAQQLAVAIKRVERYYPSIARVLTARIVDHTALVTALLKVYGSRFASIKIRKAGENAQDVTPPNSTATPGPGHPDYRHTS